MTTIEFNNLKVDDKLRTAKPLYLCYLLSLTLTVTSGKTYVGAAIMTGMDPGSIVEGIITRGWTFQGPSLKGSLLAIGHSRVHR